MATDPTSALTWYHKPFGRRVATSGHPYFSISHDPDPESGDTRRRRHLAGQAGL
jgi:hypothetical protein